MKEWDGTEAEHLEDSGYEVEIDDDSEREVTGRVITSERIDELKRLYDVAKAAKVGTTIICPVCKTEHIKTTYHKVFCSNGKKGSKDCKSRYWNTIHPERLDRLY